MIIMNKQVHWSVFFSLGVRRKRIKGDVWEFKKICDQIFKATHL